MKTQRRSAGETGIHLRGLKNELLKGGEDKLGGSRFLKVEPVGDPFKGRTYPDYSNFRVICSQGSDSSSSVRSGL
jgi:hypothetical protein